MTVNLFQAPNVLSAEEEHRVNQILKEFAETVRKRRLMVYPYFKDFDRVRSPRWPSGLFSFVFKELTLQRFRGTDGSRT